MKTYLLKLSFALVLSMGISKLQAQITRGASPGELYISCFWYIDNDGVMHNAIWRTTDNGAHLTLQYESNENAPPSEMTVGTVLGDATPGALYNYGDYKLWTSFDYGKSWEYRETMGGRII